MDAKEKAGEFFDAENITQFPYKRQLIFGFVALIILMAWKFGIESLID